MAIAATAITFDFSFQFQFCFFFLIDWICLARFTKSIQYDELL